MLPLFSCVGRVLLSPDDLLSKVAKDPDTYLMRCFFFLVLSLAVSPPSFAAIAQGHGYA